MKTRIHILIFSLTSLLMSKSSNAQSTDYRSQVLFIYNFIKYMNWPTNSENFTIGVIGNSSIILELNKLASIKKTPDGKSIVIRTLNDLKDARFCNIVYVPDSHSKEVEALANELKAVASLIVCERDGLTKKGAEISFFIDDDDRLGISISRKNADSKKIKISGELLRLAELID